MGLCASIASSRALGTREGTCTTATTPTPAPASVHRDVDAHSETALTKLGFELVLAPRLPGRPNEPRNNTATLRRYPRISTIPYDPRWNLKWRKIVPKYPFHQQEFSRRLSISSTLVMGGNRELQPNHAWRQTFKQIADRANIQRAHVRLHHGTFAPKHWRQLWCANFG
jgi:hypothetical protein